MSSIVSDSKKLSQILLNLDIDEGVLIESAKDGRVKMFINKRTSGQFVLEIVSSQSTNNTEIKFCRDVRFVRKIIDGVIGKDYHVAIY